MQSATHTALGMLHAAVAVVTLFSAFFPAEVLYGVIRGYALRVPAVGREDKTG